MILFSRIEFSASFSESDVKPRKTSFDYHNGNKDKHQNRILLEAEPQIGKTGVYLGVTVISINM